MFFGRGGEGGGGGVCGDAEDDVVLGIDVFFKGEMIPVNVDCEVIEIEVTASGGSVGVEVSPGQGERFLGSVVQPLIKNIVGILLNGEVGIFQEGKILHAGRVVEVDENAGPFAFGRLENGLEQADKVEWGERLGNFQMRSRHLDNLAGF